MEIVSVIVIADEVVKHNWAFSTSEKAEAKFLALIRHEQKDLSEEDESDILNDGYYGFRDGNGSICISQATVDKSEAEG